METMQSTVTEVAPPPAANSDPKKPAKANGIDRDKQVIASADLIRAAVEADPHYRALVNWQKKIFKLRDKKQREEKDRPDLFEAVETAQKALDEANEKLRLNTRTASDIDREILTVATGGFSEKLDFEGAAESTVAPTKTSADVAKQLYDDFGKLTLAEIGVKPSIIEKLDVEAIRTGADLRKWIQAHPPKDIKGIGRKGMEALGDLMTNKMMAMSEAMKKSLPPNGVANAVKPRASAEVIAEVATEKATSLKVAVWKMENPETGWAWSWQAAFGTHQSLNAGINARSRDDASLIALDDVGAFITKYKDGLDETGKTQWNAVDAEFRAAIDLLKKNESAVRPDTVIFAAVTPKLLELQVGQRNNNLWANRWNINVGIEATPDVAHQSDWAGDYASRIEAAAWGIDAIREFAQPILAREDLSNRVRNCAKAALKDLDGAEERLAEEVDGSDASAEEKSFWAQRTKAAEPDSVPLAKAMGKGKHGRAKNKSAEMKKLGKKRGK